jgi:hypothetical protein
MGGWYNGFLANDVAQHDPGICRSPEVEGFAKEREGTAWALKNAP